MMLFLMCCGLAQAQNVPPDELPDEAPELTAPALKTVVAPVTRMDVSLAVGGRAYTQGFGGSPSIRLGVGYRLPVIDDQLRIGLTGGWARPTAKDSITDPRLNEPANWHVTQRQIHLGIELIGSPGAQSAPLRIEIVLAPELTWMQTTGRAQVAGAYAGETVERRVTVGGRVGG
ncbi:MAG: hypothetical protein ACI9MC_002243, partial [Kiritimatiellia bacterium]